MTVLRARAPGKVNLCLHVGPVRADGLHEIVSVVVPLQLADDLELEPAERDEVLCPGVEGDNLAARALQAYREATGIDSHWRLRIRKRVPVAAGMGGGSADAAAALRLVDRAAGGADPALLERLAPGLGADVPALLRPGPALVTGAGEVVRDWEGGIGWSFVVVPLNARLSAADVYAQADRLGLPRSRAHLDERAAALEAVRGGFPLAAVHNDLEPAARTLCPAIEPALAAVAEVAEKAVVAGSGPTVFGLCADDAAARKAARTLAPDFPGALAVPPA